MTTRYIDGHGTTLSDEMCVKKKRERDGKGEDDYCEIGESERGRYKRGGNFN